MIRSNIVSVIFLNYYCYIRCSFNLFGVVLCLVVVVVVIVVVVVVVVVIIIINYY